MYECFHCLSNSVCWSSDYDFEDFGLDGDGIIHICHCSNCGAEIEYRISINQEEEKSDNENKMTIYDFIDDKGVNENGKGRLNTF